MRYWAVRFKTRLDWDEKKVSPQSLWKLEV